MKSFFFTPLIIIIALSHAVGQTDADQLKAGLKYKNQLKHEKMFEVFDELIQKDSNNIDYIINMSLAYTSMGQKKSSETEKLDFYGKGKKLAAKARVQAPNNAEGHYAYALALARENENAKTKVQIANAKEIKRSCEKTLELDSTFAGAFHILGRWHRTFALFSNFEKAMVNAFFGGVPEGGSFKDALEMFHQAIKLEPWYMLHTYELAVTYHEMGKDDHALKCVKKAITLPQKYDDAKECYKDCQKLLKKLQG